MKTTSAEFLIPPCPFCGGRNWEVHVSHVGHRCMAVGACDGCGCMMYSHSECGTVADALLSLQGKLRMRSEIETRESKRAQRELEVDSGRER